MGAAAIEVTDLRKSYGAVEAVRGISLTVAEGEVFALLGPNGAGKTTTVEILEGFRRRDAGNVSVLGFDPAKGERRLKEQLGIVLQTSGVDPYLTVAETVDMFRGYYPKPRPRDEVIELVGLTEKKDSRVTKLSGGQQRRLDVAIALAGGIPFLDFQVPQAVIKLKQGFGRLIRTKTDTGLVVILDPRVLTKRYGRTFLDALPACRRYVDGVAEPGRDAEP